MKNEENVIANLQERAIAAHGGLPRWEQLSAVRAHLIQGGVLWAVKGQANVVDDVFVRVDLHRQFTRHYPIGGPGRHSVFRGDYVAIEDESGGIVEERKDPTWRHGQARNGRAAITDTRTEQKGSLK
jgi:hypothetical protein